ncbi:leucine-rich PPR motif-containing protein, mitochondrial [Drosophila tropicalis]|uniref:leucine-rich PPR motif-containing protein, mitochondrial n=1 Tax=Drosophila tropicalis TaxID=46794 RepID=UPI0035ABE118
MQRARLLQALCTHWSGRILRTAAATWPVPSSRWRYAIKSSPLPQQLQLSSSARSVLASTREKRTRPTTNNNFSATPISLEEQWTKLEAYYQQHSLLHYDQCLRLLEQLESTNSQQSTLNAGQLHFLLGACVPELMPAQSAQERMELYGRIWKQLVKVSQPTLSHYHTQLQVRQQNQLKLADHRSLLAEIAVFNGPADAALYTALLDVACACGNMRQATELLTEMREKNFPLTEKNFHALLLGNARQGNLDGAESVVASMRAAGIATDNPITQSIRFVGYAENGEIAKSKELLRQNTNFTAPQIVQMLRGALKAKEIKLDVVQQLIKLLPRDYVNGVDMPQALRSLSIQLIYQNEIEVVMEIVALLPTPKFNENQNVDGYAALILQECFRSGIPLEKTLEFALQLKQRGQNPRALHLVTELALRRPHQPAWALQCLKALSAEGEELRPHYFWPLIISQHRTQGEQGILSLLKEMQLMKVECNEETVTQYVFPHLHQTLQQPVEGIQLLNEVGLKPSQVLGPLLAQVIQRQEFDASINLLQLYPTRIDLVPILQPLATLAVHARATKRFQVFAKLVQALQQHSTERSGDFVGQLLLQMCSPQSRLRQDIDSLQRFLHEMQRLELQISPSAAESLMAIARQCSKKNPQSLESLGKTLNKMKNSQLSLPADSSTHLGGFIKHPRDMTLDELECHLIELEAKQMNTRGVLRRLLQLSVRDNRLERAQELLLKCQALGVQTSPGMLASIFDLNIKRKDLQKAQKSLNLLQTTYPGFQIDEHKLIDYAALLVHGQQLETAKELLQQRAEQHKINGGDYVLKNVWQLLNNVAQLPHANESEPNLTYEIFNFMRKLGYCQAHNALLGPVVREWLIRQNMDAAVAEFQRLATQHKHTPLQYELLSLLVRLGNGNAEELARYPGLTAEQAQKHLAAVTSTVSRVHGASNLNSALLLALAESGTENQLRRLVINPEFRINHDLLVKNCEHLGQEGAVRTLLRLARGVRGVQRTIDEQRIYDMLLSQFVKSNNYEAALDLFERLEADDELKISLEFLRNLVKLLRLNNIEIPSNIALRAQIR